jgi:hypothetical protein
MIDKYLFPLVPLLTLKKKVYWLRRNHDVYHYTVVSTNRLSVTLVGSSCFNITMILVDSNYSLFAGGASHKATTTVLQ